MPKDINITVRTYANKEEKIIPKNEHVKPFLKWAGGKTQLIPELLKYVPKFFNKYIEPFVGGGALYFNLSHTKSIISDSNEELIITYKEVRDNPDGVIDVLDSYRNEESFYYKIRGLEPEKLSNSERAARFIYLNKTCYNGLYRVNKQGKFNVPYGKRTGNFYNRETLIAASEHLSNAKIFNSDYQYVLNKYAQEGDFIFLDPPYYPKGGYADFNRYTKEFFYEEDHVKLANAFKDLIERGCYVILTNSDHPSILELYKDYNIEIIDSRRAISSNPKTRKGKDIIVLGNL